MADMYAVSGETLTGIANAIRTKTGSDEQMTVASMARAIEGISGGGTEIIEVTERMDFPGYTWAQLETDLSSIIPDIQSVKFAVFDTSEVNNSANLWLFSGFCRTIYGVCYGRVNRTSAFNGFAFADGSSGITSYLLPGTKIIVNR